MKRSSYVPAAVVVVTSLAAALLLPHGELVQTLAAIPIFGSLSAVVVQMFRDQATRQHERELAGSQNRFVLAAGSHMATTAFDKHVAFCEEYMAEVFVSLDTLFREGPTQKALEHSHQLHLIKRKHGLWVTSHIERRLEPFETALRGVGASNLISQQFPESERHQNRINEMYRHFAEVLGTEHMGSEWEGKAITDTAAVSRVVSHLREVLGVEELTRLRTAVVEQALNLGPASDG